MVQPAYSLPPYNVKKNECLLLEATLILELLVPTAEVG
jgi:hypothetical protein